MREALARSDHDFVIAEEPRRKPRAAPAQAAAARTAEASSRKRRVFAFLMRRPGRTLAGVLVAAVVTGIVLNAVLFQTGQHPSPLFGSPRAAAPAPKSAVAAAPPLPAPRPASLAPAAPAPAPAPVARAPETPAAPPTAPRVATREAEPAPAPVAAKKDPIAALLNGETPQEASAPNARVAAVQKALIKSGFVLRADGVMGATTRQALERFERDRRLPVTGDLSPRTLRELAEQSGVAIP